MKYTITNNQEHKGVEISFDCKPSEEIRNAMKAIGLRWHSVKKVWYGHTDAGTAQAAIEAGEEAAAPFRDGEKIPEYEEEKALNLDQFETVEGGTLYEGWRGSNNNKWTTDAELKQLIINDCKKCGIKCSIRFHKAGYLTAFTATMTINADEVKSFDEWLADKCNGYINQYCPANGWNPYTRPDGKIDFIFSDFGYIDNAPISDEMRENIAKSDYQNKVNHLTTTDNVSAEVLKSAAARRFELLKKIVTSYNHDQSNSMIDYFDRDIYDSYALKII